MRIRTPLILYASLYAGVSIAGVAPALAQTPAARVAWAKHFQQQLSEGEGQDPDNTATTTGTNKATLTWTNWNLSEQMAWNYIIDPGWTAELRKRGFRIVVFRNRQTGFVHQYEIEKYARE